MHDDTGGEITFYIIFSYRAQLSSCWARSRWASVRLISALTILRSSKSSFSKSVYPFALPPHVRPVESLFAEADYMFSHLYVAVVELEELRAMMTWRYLRLSIDFVHNLVINRLYLIDRKSFSFHGHGDAGGEIIVLHITFPYTGRTFFVYVITFWTAGPISAPRNICIN